jgi:single-strand DNA-binding protein
MRTYLTVTGNLTSDPTTRHTKDGYQITEFGLAHNHRKQDRSTGLWEDTEPTFYTVTCWRRLAEGVAACLHKGDPVVVFGKFSTREYERSNGQLRSELKIEADAVGPDLQWVVAAVTRRTSSSAAQQSPAASVAPVPSWGPGLEDEDEVDPMADVEAALAQALPGGSE